MEHIESTFNNLQNIFNQNIDVLNKATTIDPKAIERLEILTQKLVNFNFGFIDI
ncbi:hypothetical protein P344_02805 [Spiroplasma mirum ATCC 29335]|uniref:Uncharacterized protein n=1 Tax=Spiroplasma mirum ATCC 29335 TaxID=838561 RepID=W6ALL1_9MOLU|nr:MULTISPECIES: hypothetical protein [Spiroplasma]AHI57906.1 hypothetical protein P344_02805 [Spiroplasma mirum ATCC 29335]AKM53016.1 hypothetical protein SATRI_v1c05280 [Spiroplasma atrichopogonis]